MTENKTQISSPGQLRRKSFSSLVYAIITLILILYLSNYIHYRIDLTAEKRYTISPETKQVLKNLKDVVFVRIYLDGDLPIGFKKMQERIRELLDDFRIYAGDNLEYEFVNPLKSQDARERERLLFDLANRGLRITNILDRDKEGGTSEKKIVPGAIIRFKKAEIPVNLLKNNTTLSAEENLNNSIQSLEYEFIHVVKRISSSPQKIAFIEGHGELDQYQVDDITAELLNYYQVERLMIDGNVNRLGNFQAVIIAKPQKPFPEADKFAIDQYIMNGGKVLFFLDEVQVSLDSMIKGNTMAMIRPLNLEDQLFRYGFRINPSLLQDAVCANIPINTSPDGTEARFYPAPWIYYPLLQPSPFNPATRYVQLVRSEFPSTIDTLKIGVSVRRSILLSSSKYSRTIKAPVIISLEEIKHKPGQEDFNLSDIPVAVLAEGSFKSVFQNRMLSGLGISGNYTFLPEGKETKLFVAADGDIIRNDVLYSPQGPMKLPLGFDRFSKVTFGNKDFVLNLVNYMTDESGLIRLRGKEFRLRLLDKTSIRTGRLQWQLVNTILPVLLIVLAGIFLNYFRQRKHTTT